MEHHGEADFIRRCTDTAVMIGRNHAHDPVRVRSLQPRRPWSIAVCRKPSFDAQRLHRPSSPARCPRLPRETRSPARAVLRFASAWRCAPSGPRP